MRSCSDCSPHFLNGRADIAVVIGWGNPRVWEHDHIKHQSTVEEEEAMRNEEVEEHDVGY